MQYATLITTVFIFNILNLPLNEIQGPFPECFLVIACIISNKATRWQQCISTKNNPPVSFLKTCVSQIIFVTYKNVQLKSQDILIYNWNKNNSYDRPQRRELGKLTSGSLDQLNDLSGCDELGMFFFFTVMSGIPVEKFVQF